MKSIHVTTGAAEQAASDLAAVKWAEVYGPDSVLTLGQATALQDERVLSQSNAAVKQVCSCGRAPCSA